MKPAIAYIVLLLLVYHNGYAQRNTVSEYYGHVNRAELAVCDSNFPAAQKEYAAAFAMHPKKGFYKDIFNAFHAAMDMNDYGLGEQYFKILLSIGLDSEELVKLKRVYTADKWQIINKLLIKYPNKKWGKDPLVNKLREMVDWDQGVRAYFGKRTNGAYMVDSTYTIDEINAKALFEILKHRMPDEGVLKETGYEIIIIHNTGAALGGRPSHIFDTLLYSAANRFEYDMRNVAHLIENTAPAPSFRYGSLDVLLPLSIMGGYYKERFYPGYFDEASEYRINKAREKLGLENLEDYRKKIAAHNIGIDTNSILHKYMLTSSMGVMDFENEAKLKKWLNENGRDAIKKPSLSDVKFVAPGRMPFDAGIAGSYEISATRYDSTIMWFKNTGEWFVPNVPYATNDGFKEAHHRFGYFADVIKNRKEDSNKVAGRANLARFVEGYRMLNMAQLDFWAMAFYKPELSFYDNVLMYFTAGVDTVAYRTTMKYLGTPTTISTTIDTVSYVHDDKYKVLLKTRRYTWIKGNRKTEITLTDKLNKKGKKVTEAVFEMQDIKRYAIYNNEVKKEIARLEKNAAVRKQ